MFADGIASQFFSSTHVKQNHQVIRLTKVKGLTKLKGLPGQIKYVISCPEMVIQLLSFR